MKLLGLTLGLFLLILVSNSAQGIFDAQFFYGKRWYQTHRQDYGQGFSTKEAKLSVHIDPVPLIPVAVGLGYSYYDFDEEDFTDAAAVEGNEGTLEVVGWLPFVPGVIPYGVLGYTLFHEIVQEITRDLNQVPTTGKITDRVSGFHISLGVKYEVLPVFLLLLEADQGIQIRRSRTEFSGEETISTDGDDFNSRAMRLGVEFQL